MDLFGRLSEILGWLSDAFGLSAVFGQLSNVFGRLSRVFTRLSDSLGSSLINDQEKAGAPLSGMLISWLSLFDFDERKKLTEEQWKTCAEALMFETSSAEWELLRQRHGDANSQGLDISLLSSWFANEHSVVLDRMLRRLMRTTARALARSPPSPITPAPEQPP